jgi:GTP cyclohydrolase II
VPTVDNRQKALNSFDELMEAAEHLIVTLRATRTHYRKTRSRVEKGSSIEDALSNIPTGELRQSLTQAMAEMEAARHKVRTMTFVLGLEEGMSIGELGRVWGFSRQLAARYAKEAKKP